MCTGPKRDGETQEQRRQRGPSVRLEHDSGTSPTGSFLKSVGFHPHLSATPALLDIIRATAVCKACCSPPICLLAVQIQELRPDDLQWMYLQTRLQPTATETHSFTKRPRPMMVSAGSLSWDFPWSPRVFYRAPGQTISRQAARL